MEKFKEALIQFAHSNPSFFPNDAANSYPAIIEQCFPQFFPDFQTPDHPPYAAMIYQAIRELNKKGGSSEKSISKYIIKEYADLPWAHSTLLKHHLEKLCDRKELCMTQKQCYLLAGAELESGKESSAPSKICKKQKSRSGSEASKKSTRPHKKHKKNEKCRLGVQEASDMEQTGLHKRKRKQRLKSKRKRSKRAKKHEINVGTGDEPREQKQMLEVNNGDIQIQEQDEVNQESHLDNSGYINLEQSQTKKNLEHLQPEESPDSNPILHRNGKRVWTRSQLKTISKKDTLAASSELTDSTGYANIPKDKAAIAEDLPNEKQQISRSLSSEKPLIELLNQISSKSMPRSPDDEQTTVSSSTVLQDPISSRQDQQPQKSPVEDEPKYNRLGRHPKHTEPEKDEVLHNFKSAANPRKGQKLVKKGKVGDKKDQQKYKRQGGHKMTRKSSRKTSC